MKKLIKSMLIVLCGMVIVAGFVAYGGDDDNNNSNGGDNSSLVGTWRMDFGTNSYILLTFNQNGTGQYREYDKNTWQHDDAFTYTYDSEAIYATGGGKTRKIVVISHSKTTLVLKDFPDDGANMFIKQ